MEKNVEAAKADRTWLADAGSRVKWSNVCVDYWKTAINAKVDWIQIILALYFEKRHISDFGWKNPIFQMFLLFVFFVA